MYTETCQRSVVWGMNSQRRTDGHLDTSYLFVLFTKPFHFKRDVNIVVDDTPPVCSRCSRIAGV